MAFKIIPDKQDDNRVFDKVKSVDKQLNNKRSLISNLKTNSLISS